MAWSSSDRRQRLPRDWPALVAATRSRANGRCEGISIHGEERWHVDACDGAGRECDHDKRGDDHRLENLRWLSSECHQRKTFLERPQRARPGRRHPGVPPGTGSGTGPWE